MSTIYEDYVQIKVEMKPAHNDYFGVVVILLSILYALSMYTNITLNSYAFPVEESSCTPESMCCEEVC